jgi:serine/threonine protein kinase
LWKVICTLKKPSMINYAKVLLVEHLWTEKRLVVKVFPDHYRHHFQRELFANRYLHSAADRNTFALVHLEDNDDDGYYDEIINEFGPSTLIFEYAPRGDMLHLVEQMKRHREAAGSRMTIEEISATQVYLCTELAKCLTKLHDWCEVAHLDLKLENFIVTTSLRLALIDFGSAELLSKHGLTRSHCMGTPEYRSPEQSLSSLDYFNGFNADIFSLGVMMLAIITQRLPIRKVTGTTEDDI